MFGVGVEGEGHNAPDNELGEMTALSDDSGIEMSNVGLEDVQSSSSGSPANLMGLNLPDAPAQPHPVGSQDLAVKSRGKAPLLDMAGSHSADEDVGSIASSNPSEDLEATPSFSGWY